MSPMKYLTSRGNQISGSVFLIGLGICFLAQHIFPGVLYALAVSLIVPQPGDRANPGQAWNRFTGALVLAAIGLMFDLQLEGWSLVGVVLVCIGVFSLFGALAIGSRDDETTKTEATGSSPERIGPDRHEETEWDRNGVGVGASDGYRPAKPHINHDLS